MASYEHSFNLNDLAIFVEIAKRRNISKAAEVTGVPSSTLSRRLSILEAHIGVQLLARSTRKMALTEAGKLYFERCRELIELAFNAREALREEGRRLCGKLRILLPGALESLRVVEVIGDIVRTSPELSVECDYYFGEGSPANREFDVALRWGTQADTDMAARLIWLFPFHLYASPEYVARHGQPEAPEDLRVHQCLVFDGCRELLIWSLGQGGKHQAVHPQGPLRVNSLDTTYRLALAGAGIAALPSHGDRRDTLVRVLTGWTLTPVALYAAYGSRMPSASARAFVAALIEWFSAKCDERASRATDKNVRLRSCLGQLQESTVQVWG